MTNPLAEALAALKPFSDEAAGRESMPDYYELWIRCDDDDGMGMLDLKLSDLRRAADTYTRLSKENAPPQKVTDGWYDMESAPKDGTSIAMVRWWPDAYGKTEHWTGGTFAWSERERGWLRQDQQEVVKQCRWNSGILELDSWRWRPLPLPPSESATKGT